MRGATRMPTRMSAGTLIVICLSAGMLQADIGIKPAFVEVNLDEGRPAGTFLISNLGDKEERFRINAVHFTYTEKGSLLRSPRGEHSLAPWIRFNPRELTLAPKTQRAVRFAVVPREKLTEGEWWAAMELESLEVNEIVSKQDEAGRSVKLKAITSIMAPIFGTTGRTTYDGQVKDVQIQAENGAAVLKTLVGATGTGRLGLVGKYEILDDAGTTVSSGPFGSAYVLRGTQRWLTKKLDAGNPGSSCTVRVSFQAAHLGQPLTKEIQVTWPEVPPAETAKTETDSAVQPASEEPQGQSENPTDGRQMDGGAGK